MRVASREQFSDWRYRICNSPRLPTYNDGSQPISLTYSDNEVLSYGYDGGSGWLSSLTATPAGGSATTLLGGIGYSGAGGAAGHATSASIAGGMYTYSASYDADLRLSSLSVAHSGSTLFSSQRGYDAVGNVTAVGTTLAAGTDNQVFCYDDQHRLTWAGSTGTPNCGTSLTPGSLTSANYTQTYTYDTLDRLQSGPLGSYSYGDSAHLHAVTSITSGGTTAYSAAYDAGGNMTCRAPTSSATCSGTPTGAQLSFDNEGRLSAWQNTPSSPTSSDSFLYDGEGARVEQQSTTNGSIITSTVYVAGGLEEITSTGSTSTLTKYFGAQGLPTAERVGTNGPLSYLATDGQGTVSETLDSSGSVTSAQLYTPYGSVRYSSGSSPTSLGYTGQRADGATGLDYYHARYYDPVAGQFVSADSVDDGLNRYGYVKGNPTTATDPSGHRFYIQGMSGAEQEQVNRWMIKAALRYRRKSGGGKKHPKGGSGGSREEPAAPKAEDVGGGESGGPRAKTIDAIPNKAAWGESDPSHKYTVWLSKLDWDQVSGYHLNLHIQSYNSGHDLHNFHITYGGWSPSLFPVPFGNIWNWLARDFIPGRISGSSMEFGGWGLSNVREGAENAAMFMLSTILGETIQDDDARNFFLATGPFSLWEELVNQFVRLSEVKS